jgi:hypothetical protein
MGVKGYLPLRWDRRRKQRTKRVVPTDARRRVVQARARVDALEGDLAKARRAYHAAIVAAHDEGVSMAELGRLVGVSRQRVAELIEAYRRPS